jgi:D-psicose/D-tagatose/L-ribulose 3-epimerase
MRIGCCTNMLGRADDAVGAWAIEEIVAGGYDYLELPVVQTMELTEPDFRSLHNRVKTSGLSCEVCNNFFPAELALTGPEVKKREVRDYYLRALERISGLGAGLVVFGSGAARMVPAGFSAEDAHNQLARLLQEIAAEAEPLGITIVIEPLNRGECNIVNSALEGFSLMKSAGRPNVRLLVDYFHMGLESENMASILEAGDAIRHAHISNPQGRVFPSPGDGAAYAVFTGNLERTGYKGRLSVEAYSTDLSRDAARACGYMKELTGESP